MHDMLVQTEANKRGEIAQHVRPLSRYVRSVQGTAGSEVKDTCRSSWCASLGEPRLSVARARSSMVHVDAESVISIEAGFGAIDEMRFRRAGSSPCEASISSFGAA